VDEALYPHLYEIEDRHWWFRGRRAVIWALIVRAELPSSPRLLDAGCGTGRNLQEFGVLGRPEGVDTSQQAVDFCRRRGLAGVRRAGLEALPYDEASFDLLMACDVIEHVRDDRGALRELRRVAKAGARLLVTVPAYMWLWSHHDDSHHHLRRYTQHNLTELARSAGWTPLLATHFNSILLPPIALVRRVQRRRRKPESTDYELTPGWLNDALALPMRAEADLIRRGVSLPAGVSIGLICKPL
jgi:SAM-dependent methyltransferase